MDDLRDKFVEKQNEQADAGSFKYLRNNGILSLATQSFENYADENYIPKSRIVKNAYLLQYERISQEFHEQGYELDEIERQIRQVSLTPIKTLQNYASDYIARNGGSKTLSDNIYAATIAYTALTNSNKGKDYIGLIGAEAYMIAKTSEKCRQNYNFFRGCPR